MLSPHDWEGHLFFQRITELVTEFFGNGKVDTFLPNAKQSNRKKLNQSLWYEQAIVIQYWYNLLIQAFALVMCVSLGWIKKDNICTSTSATGYNLHPYSFLRTRGYSWIIAIGEGHPGGWRLISDASSPRRHVVSSSWLRRQDDRPGLSRRIWWPSPAGYSCAAATCMTSRESSRSWLPS